MDGPGPSGYRTPRGMGRRGRDQNPPRRWRRSTPNPRQNHFQNPQKRKYENDLPALKDRTILPPPNKVRRFNNDDDRVCGGKNEPAAFNHLKMNRNLNFAKNHNINFKVLESIALSDNTEILMRINEKREAFLKLLKSEIDKPDIFVLLTKVMAKVAQCSFTVQKSNLLIEMCNSKYMETYQSYLTNLPYKSAQEKSQNRLYWENQESFWDNFITFCECIVNISPSTALQTCRALIHGTSKCCLESLSQRHGLVLSEQLTTKLALLREKLNFCESEHAENLGQNKRVYGENGPRESFRELNVVPSSHELLSKRPFVRANVVKGGYRDIEHYLDVQFRLLREDCFGPLREGIRQYMEQPQKKKYDHIRVFKNVNFVGPYIPKSQDNVGSLVKINMDSNRWMRRVKWAHSKRLLFGSLVLFTKDNCSSFIAATILHRDVKMLENGVIAVNFVDMTENAMGDDDQYTMIESEVYFEPYFHVLNALQDPEFPEHVAMKKYIVEADCTPKPPAYLQDGKEFSIKTELKKYKFNVLDDSQWPTKEELTLNESQYKAFKLAITHEFAVIQGPPGTGKTFLGVKLAQTLLRNLSVKKGTLMLVICYTNHALDQFLEAIMGFTKSVARIGGRSRNEAMDEINLHTLRRNSPNVTPTQMNTFFKYKKSLQCVVHQLKEAMESLDSVINSVFSYESITTFIQESTFLANFYPGCKDPLQAWLFENYIHYSNPDPILWEDYDDAEENTDFFENTDDDFRQAHDAVLEDFEEYKDFEHAKSTGHSLSFSLNTAESEIRRLTNSYKNSDDHQEKNFLTQRILELRGEINLFKKMSAHRNRDSCVIVKRVRDPSAISTIDRWCLYFKWEKKIIADITKRIPPLQAELRLRSSSYEETRAMVDLEVLKGTQVVAMTTSGAARLRKLVQSLAPPVVIVEEAAEVMEQHLVTSLTKDCEHLILIGDHQQLRPSVANLKLARRQHTDVSLFERMITNGMHSRRLGVQHRMRPEIAALISPHIYPDLQNHPSVHHFPNVRGITNNLFFFTHNLREQAIEDSESRSNHKEADLTLALANYMVLQGYNSEDVTILTTYAGQMFYMKKQRENYPRLSAVKMTVVDNYQGEESKIILLSLVRNNDSNEVGFLKIENRICVALSRAREGLFIFGNIEALKSNSELWKNIATTLESNGSLGTSLTLKCENHPSEITKIRSAEDFRKVPEGGCLLQCGSELPCGHSCTRMCHGFDREHKIIRCHETCTRVLCDLGHVCPLKCSVPCAPCKKLVEKTLPCEHQMKVQCHREVTDSSIKCQVIVPATLSCGHEVKKECHLALGAVVCLVPCRKRVEPCGHQCGRKCHVDHDPHHEEYVCTKPCAKPNNGCTAEEVDDASPHNCKKKCFETCEDCPVQVLKARSTCSHSGHVACSVNIDETPCNKICNKQLPCGHKCQKKCFEPCNCSQKVTKTISECNHEVEIACSKTPTREMCRRKCERKLTCGHSCPNRCDMPCDTTNCTKLIPEKIESPCGHTVMLPCNISTTASAKDPAVLLSHCMEPCTETLACEHMCGGTCSGCHQGRLHAACTKTCHQINICGHQCEEPCNQMCPPCKKPCIVQCYHTICDRACGAPCVSCVERCRRACKHGACRRRCGEPCSRPPCDEPCAKRLRCGHACRGLCGEPCPDYCKRCHPDDPRKDLGGYDFDDDDILIQLTDCPHHHIMTLEMMDKMMKIEQEQVKIPTCPWCRVPIINTSRYKDIINRMLKKEINPIKERVYGTTHQIKEKKETLLNSIGTFHNTYKSLLHANEYMKTAFNHLNAVAQIQKKDTLLKLEMQSQYLTIMSIIGDHYKKYKEGDLKALKDELFCLIKIICRSLIANVNKISEQQQKDIGNELKRMNAIIQLSKILSHTAYVSTKEIPKVATAMEMAKQAVLSFHKFDEREAMAALQALQVAVKVSGVVTRQERGLIVRAIGLKAGHWYKCPNGHFYCIGECGGAMQESRCPECDARIGGTSHRLLAGNAHAPEMDGSQFAAWSEEYNNMANFQF